MSEKLRKMKIIIVGFKVSEERSVLYRKLDTPNDSELGALLNKAFHEYNCDFVSIRKKLLEAEKK